MGTFSFKRFTIEQDGCAMKVGTDGVLLGAWVGVRDGAMSVLDVGTGTGLVGLMLAQRYPNVRVIGVEIDEGAVSQARKNIEKSPFAERMEVVCKDVRGYNPGEQFDVIVCNPPYFVNSMRCPDALRTRARHSVYLSQEELLEVVVRLMTRNGEFSVIYPTDKAETFEIMARARGLFLTRELKVKPTPWHEVKRRIMTFSYMNMEVASEDVVIEKSRNVYTEEYRELTKDFYLNF